MNKNKIVDYDYTVIASIIAQKSKLGESACGPSAIQTFFNVIKSKNLVCKTMCYYNSGQMAPTMEFWQKFTPKSLFQPEVENSSVGYGAFAFFEQNIFNNLKTIFSPYECYNLSEYCHRIIKTTVFEPLPIFFPGVELKKGIFVTINKNGQLRGCIGTLELSQPIAESLGKYTLQSAFFDSRFSPISAAELSSLTVEISLLDSKKEVTKEFYLQSFKPGEDGIEIVIPDGRHAFFLPSVSEEYPDKVKLLEMLCDKLGSKNKKCWEATGTKFYINNGFKLEGL